ncbi:MAG: formylmethanofuran dehydrogenase [Proteobacteria bacterium]|nr:formylmethanofuran dehydrogenase [Pseudomonadota bacterium]
MKSFEELLQVSTRIHGHICAGQVIGVRMSMLALALLGINDPQGGDRKKLYVIVEIDRCATDAIQSVTGCSLGKRSMKWLDHGIMAATFVNLELSKAVRVTALEEARELAKNYCAEITDKYARQLEAYKIMPENELFRVEAVSLIIPPEDLPGRPLRRVQCESCADWVQDSRDEMLEGKVLCRNCAHGRYYTNVSEKPLGK